MGRLSTNETFAKIAKYLYIAFFITSFISYTLKEKGLHLVWSRTTVADFIVLLALVFTIPAFLHMFKNLLKFPKPYLAAGILLIGFLITAIFSSYPMMTLVECIIILFLLLISIGIYLTFRETPLSSLLSWFMWGAILFTVIGFYDLAAEQYGFYRVFPVAKYPGVLIAGFKNTGQAGSFFMIIFILLLPLRFSKTIDLISKSRRLLLNIALVSCLLMLFTLGKYSVIFGLIVGTILFALFTRRKAIVFYLIAVIVFFIGFIQILKVILPDAYGRVGFKFENRVLKNELNTKEAGFIEENFTAAITAFIDHPITGCGLGTFQCTYHFYEVHSTYLKMLGEAGLIGVFAYLFFMFRFVRIFPINWKQSENPLTHYLQCMLPLLLGAFVTWTYTYHLRKREFWILLAIVLIVDWKRRRSELDSHYIKVNDQI
ncbi:O-antigen ligase family protein [Patiriisocius sp. Uisw_047]|jgi:O-antigen ligase|uniref:O-antigen ligase family protein n=1 Tax=Patiriisocius sp. Uisw_047 TaxID=3230969 RepID=UPI0039E9EF61